MRRINKKINEKFNEFYKASPISVTAECSDTRGLRGCKTMIFIPTKEINKHLVL